MLSVILLTWTLLSSGIIFAKTPEKLVFVFVFVPFVIYLGIRLANMRLGVLGFLDGSVVMGGLSCLALAAFPDETNGGSDLGVLGGNPIDATRALTFAILCLALRAWIIRPRPALLLTQLALGAVFAWYGVQTGSRGPWLALLVAIFLAAALSRHRFKIMTIGLVASTILFATWRLGAKNAIGDLPLFDRVFGVSQTDDITTGRGEIATVAIEGIRSNPLGIGWGSFGDFSRSYGLSSTEYAHNIFLEVAVESGILGIAGFIFFLIAVYSFVWRSRMLGTGTVAGIALTFWIVAALFSSDFGGNRGVWLCAGIAIGSYTLAKPAVSRVDG
ncbi:O-antigen ligase family protein [Dietzia sp. SLG510A3-30A2]|nr:O-antigen ligase family protein [Dietzia sp. SLG510A3-30A2]